MSGRISAYSTFQTFISQAVLISSHQIASNHRICFIFGFIQCDLFKITFYFTNLDEVFFEEQKKKRDGV